MLILVLVMGVPAIAIFIGLCIGSRAYPTDQTYRDRQDSRAALARYREASGTVGSHQRAFAGDDQAIDYENNY